MCARARVLVYDSLSSADWIARPDSDVIFLPGDESQINVQTQYPSWHSRTHARLVQPCFEIRHEFSLVVVRLLRGVESVGPLVRRVRCCPVALVGWLACWNTSGRREGSESRRCCSCFGESLAIRGGMLFPRITCDKNVSCTSTTLYCLQ